MIKSMRWFAIISILLAIIMCFSLIACNGKDKDSDVDTDTDSGVPAGSFTVTFKQEGEEDTVIVVEKGKTISVPKPKEIAGYSVVWDQNLKGVKITENVVVNAKKAPVENTIYYHTNGGINSENNPKSFTIEDQIAFEAPTRAGYEFIGWYSDLGLYSPLTGVSKGTATPVINAYAKWDPVSYNISYVLDGGRNPLENPYNYNAESTGAFLDAQKKGYEFLGWYMEPDFSGNAVEAIEDVATTGDNITLYARFRLQRFSITYVNVDDEGVVNDNSVDFDKSENIVFKAPERPSYIFGGWYADDKFKEAVTEIPVGTMEDQTVYAKWTAEKYSIEYVVDKNFFDTSIALDNIKEYTVETDALLNNPVAKQGYEFAGWYVKDDTTHVAKFSPGVISGDLVLEAKYQPKKYEIDYHANGGVIPIGSTYYFTLENTGTKKVLLPTLERKGYTFTGWYSDNSYSDDKKITHIDGTIMKNVSVYAGWTLDKYTITYNTNLEGITVVAPKEYTVEDRVIFDVFEPTEDHTFIGWYLESDYQTKVENTADLVGNLTLYAKWQGPVTQIGVGQVESFTGAETKYGDWKQLFDGDCNSAGGWYVGNGWTGGVATATITLDTEYYITSAQVYLWSNWSTAAIKFYDEQENLVGTFNFNGENYVSEPIDLGVSNIKVKKIELITMNSKGDRNHQWVELILNVGKAPVEEP